MTDIIRTSPCSYIVIGFFTPDYRPLAEAFASNLSEFQIPHHLYAVSAQEWKHAILMKPSITLRAMQDYENTDIILSDIDCIVRADISALTKVQGDIALHTRCKLARRRRKFQPWKTMRRATIWPSARLVVFKRTDEATALCERWLELCREQISESDPWDDEILLQKAISDSHKILVEQLPETFAAFEIDEVGGNCAIVHKSAHDKVRLADAARRKFKRARRRMFGSSTQRMAVA